MTLTSLRVCPRGTHYPGCHHRFIMHEGVEAFLSHPRTRAALELALARTPQPSVSPQDDADRILAYLAGVSERLDGLDTYQAVQATGHVEAF